VIAPGDKVWWWQRNSNDRGRRSHPERGVVLRVYEDGRALILQSSEERVVSVVCDVSKLRPDDR